MVKRLVQIKSYWRKNHDVNLLYFLCTIYILQTLLHLCVNYDYVIVASLHDVYIVQYIMIYTVYIKMYLKASIIKIIIT